jgi:hypothetical protein
VDIQNLKKLSKILRDAKDVNGPAKMLDKETLISKVEYVIDNILSTEQLEEAYYGPVKFIINGILCEMTIFRFFRWCYISIYDINMEKHIGKYKISVDEYELLQSRIRSLINLKNAQRIDKIFPGTLRDNKLKNVLK